MIGKNNPFNIRVSNSKWIGSNGSVRGFVSFDNRKFGIRAACILIMRSYRKLGVLTIQEIINRFAPSIENDTNSYVKFVCNRLCCFPFDIPAKHEYPSLLSAMSVFEGNPVSSDEIINVIREFKIVPYKKK